MQHAHSRKGARPALDTCRVLVQMVSKACPYFAQRNSHPPPVASRSAPRLAATTHTGFPSTQPSLPPLLKLTHTAGFEATLQYTKQPPGTSKHWGGAQLHGQPHERLQQYFTMTPPPPPPKSLDTAVRRLSSVSRNMRSRLDATVAAVAARPFAPARRSCLLRWRRLFACSRRA